MSFESWLQSRLTAHGFSPGPVDGILGPLTYAAITAFQRARRLSVTGKADEATVIALRQSSSSVASGRPPGEKASTSPGKRNVWPAQAGVRAFFGDVGRSQVLVPLPYPMRLAWDKKVTINRMSLHTKVADSASRCFVRIAAAYNASQRADLGLDLFGGSLNVRKMRGGSAYSMHSWGIAIDFDPERNQLNWGRDRARLARPDAETFWRIWEDEGWVSLGRSRNFDWMHIQAARL